MDALNERDLVAQYSSGELSRRELERALGRDLTFGQALLLLRKYGFELPVVPSDPASVGVGLVRDSARAPDA